MSERRRLKYDAVSYNIMAFMIKCKQCNVDHISNLYRMKEHILHRHFSNYESCPRCGQESKYNELDYDFRL
jgi:hypothetical protein